MIDLTITDCDRLYLERSGLLGFTINGKDPQTTTIRFDLGQRVIITQSENGCLQVVVERDADQTSGS